MNAGLFVLCTVPSGNTGWEGFGSVEKGDCTFVSKLLNRSTGTGGPLAATMPLRGEERPQVAVLHFSSVANRCWEALMLDGETEG